MELLKFRRSKIIIFILMYFHTILALIPSGIYNHLYIELPFLLFIFTSYLCMVAGNLLIQKMYNFTYKAARNVGEIVVPTRATMIMMLIIAALSIGVFVITYFTYGNFLISLIFPYHFIFGAMIWVVLIDFAMKQENYDEIRIKEAEKAGIKMAIFRH